MSKMILIIEDEESIQNIIRAFLEDAGYTVVLAADGLEGIEQFRVNKPDLVLLDLMLPKIDGFAVCEILRKESRVPIIMLTALDDDDSQMKGFDALADDYITKPFSMPIVMKPITGGTDASAAAEQSGRKTALAMLLGCGIGWVCGFTGSGGGILMLTVFTLVLGYNLKVAVGTSTMIMTLVALTGAVSHISLGARIFPLPMAVVVLSCLLGAVVSAKFANRCEIARLNRIVGIVLALLGIVTIAVKLL